MNTAKLFHRWKRKQAGYLDDLVRLVNASRQRGAPDDIHELRVTSRRVRVLVRLGAPGFPEPVCRDFRQWGRDVAAATSRIRDLDVAREWIEPQPGSVAAVREILRKRRRAWMAARRRIRSIPRALHRALSHPAGGRRSAERLARRSRKLRTKLRERVLADAARFFTLSPEEQHEFRRIVRRWRYLSELEQTRPESTAGTLLRRLLAAQEALGERQNLLLADQILAELPTVEGTPVLRERLAIARRGWETRIRKALRSVAG
jgi:CHAD domain-containing protein